MPESSHDQKGNGSDQNIAARSVLSSRERRFVAIARFKGAAVSYREPTTLENARRDAAEMREGATALGYTDRRVGIFELVEVERV